MKTRICLVIIALSLIFSISGCKGEVKPSLDVVVKQNPESPIIKATEKDPRTAEYQTKLKEFSFDFDSDNEEEKIELYTVAGRNEKGEMMWDDGQNWLLVVVDDGKYYTLFSEYVQIGQVYFSVSTIGQEKVPQVSILLSTGCGTEMIDYIYNNDKESFTAEIGYLVMDKNQFYTSIPGY